MPDIDFLATQYRHHSRLRAIASIDHHCIDQQLSVYINRLPASSQYDDFVSGFMTTATITVTMDSEWMGQLDMVGNQ
jgi:hypothetical protein